VKTWRSGTSATVVMMAIAQSSTTATTGRIYWASGSGASAQSACASGANRGSAPIQ
jgi:hypothetical protein